MFVVGFASAGIQPYILAGGRLRDIAAGSEAVERLCTTDLDECLKACGLPSNDPQFAAAGGFRLVVDSEDAARRFARVWSLVIAERAPGLRHAIAVLESDPGEDEAFALERLRELLEERVRRPVPAFPPANPVTLRSARTGLAAVEEKVFFDDEGPEAIDLDTKQRRSLFRRIKRVSTAIRGKVEDKFCLPPGWTFTNESDAIAVGGRNTAVAMIHIDGTGFGRMFGELDRQLRGHQRRAEFVGWFSRAVSEATRKAAVAAMAAVLHALTPDEVGQESKRDDARVLPARPIVLGGDDLTVLLAGKYGLLFAVAYLDALEVEGRNELAPLHEQLRRDLGPGTPPKLPETLAAAAGIAFTHANFPAVLSHDLAHQICDWVKDALRPSNRSGLALLRVTASHSGGWNEALKRELGGRHAGSERRRLTMAPYVAGLRASGDLIGVDVLKRLYEASRHLPRGPWREVLTLAHVDPRQADLRFQRMIEIGLRSNDERHRRAVEEVVSALSPLSAMDSKKEPSVSSAIEPKKGLPTFWLPTRDGHATPWADVAALRGVDRVIASNWASRLSDEDQRALTATS